MNDQVHNELKKIFNGRFSTSESTRANYARGEDTYDPVLSQGVSSAASDVYKRQLYPTVKVFSINR